MILRGWPNKKQPVPEVILPYYSFRDELVVHKGIILRGEQIVIPVCLRESMKKKVHMGHLGINSCLRRARYLIFWPGMLTDIREYVEKCGTCSTYQDKQPSESLYVHETSELPWQKVGTDLFLWAGKYYMVTVDYTSSFFELDYLPNTTSDMIVGKLKHHFASHGCPEYLISDNGPQYTSSVMKKMVQQWGISHQTSSPGNSQANGAAEAAVKPAKRVLRKCKAASEDPYLGLLNVRNTPQQNRYFLGKEQTP